MLRIEPPEITAQTSYATSISRVRDRTLRERLEAVEDAVIDASAQFEVHGANATLNDVPPSGDVPPVTARQLTDVYDLRFASAKGPGRKIYDLLRNSAPKGKCPYCAHRFASTLDHFLPKGNFSLLTVSPANLIPSCRECNHLKDTFVPESPGDVLVHPYFDDISELDWLFARVIEAHPAAVVFGVKGSESSDLIRKRIANHFQRLHLNQLYSAQASEELVNIRASLRELHLAGGVRLVGMHLTREAASRRQARKNSWQTALYEAIAHSKWFCDGGFEEP